jgi:hypothetical protein
VQCGDPRQSSSATFRSSSTKAAERMPLDRPIQRPRVIQPLVCSGSGGAGGAPRRMRAARSSALGEDPPRAAEVLSGGGQLHFARRPPKQLDATRSRDVAPAW